MALRESYVAPTPVPRRYVVRWGDSRRGGAYLAGYDGSRAPVWRYRQHLALSFHGYENARQLAVRVGGRVVHVVPVGCTA